MNTAVFIKSPEKQVKHTYRNGKAINVLKRQVNSNGFIYFLSSGWPDEHAGFETGLPCPAITPPTCNPLTHFSEYKRSFNIEGINIQDPIEDEKIPQSYRLKLLPGKRNAMMTLLIKNKLQTQKQSIIWESSCTLEF